jgi:cell division septum initiation protein DivIVA
MITTRLTSADLHGELFDRTGIGRRGYDPDQVDHLIGQIRAELRRREEERDALLRDRSALEQENASLRTQLGLIDRKHLAQQINTEAIDILNSAQRQAERYYAEAEDQAQQMTRDARGHCDQILGQAHQQAQAILDEAHRTADAAGNMAATAYRAATSANGYEAHVEELERKAAYLNTHCAVMTGLLRGLFEDLARRVEQWPPDTPPTGTHGLT